MKLSLASSSLCLFSLCFFVKNSDAFQSPIIGIAQQRSGDSDSDDGGLTGTIAQGRTTTIRRSMIAPLSAAPKRLDGNVDGVLFVNDNCINCSACAMFAGENFGRSDADSAHVVIKQPSTESEILESRAALAACPVAAIRVETEAHRHHRGSESLTPEQRTLTKQLAKSPKLNGLEKPFPLKLSDNVWFVGHHSSKTFGAAPYLTKVKTQLDGNSGDEDNSGDYWILVDSPKYSKSAVDAITQLAGPAGPKYMILSHVDDTAEHGKWKEQFPDLKRIFHSGDLGKHNWVGDLTLEHVEVLLQECSTDQQLQAFSLDGTPLSADKAAQSSVVIYHTPGHSPGSITLLQRDGGVLFTGDTLGYTTRTHSLTGFPRYGNDQNQQSETLTLMETQIEGWNLVAPGHGHFRDYSTADGGEHLKKREMQEAREELAASVRT